MGVIAAVGTQWEKAEFAKHLREFFAEDLELRELFSGATNIETLTHVIAALIEDKEKLQLVKNNLHSESVFLLLFDCYLLLFIKELEHGGLSQAEHLTIQVSRRYAQTMQKESSDPKVLNMAERLILSAKQLDSLHLGRRSSQRNMGAATR
ncbi:hypothetical protein [Shewanella sp. UCD-KL12]|uniref:hypothetical protein n=1 Tax=Shewanella sp. UCD-KL12 TaxID=1917163 RepID=UPI00097044F4|nr:hypothetical protein [Shewanella sp. UCD-KL12]